MPRTCFWMTILLTVFLLSCESTEKEPTQDRRIYANFFVRYLEMEEQLKAQASFREGDSLATARPVAVEGGLAFQNSGMEQRNLQGQMIRYSLNRLGQYQGDYTFSFRDEAGQPRKYSIAMTPVEAFSLSGPVSPRAGATLTVDGGELADDESLVLLFTDRQNQASSVTIDGPTQSGIYTLPPEQLQGLAPGNGQLYLVKKKRKLQADGRYDVVMEMEYYTGNVVVEVGE